MPSLRKGDYVMRAYVDTYNQVEGFHQYPNAPKFCAYLGERHRHMFVIRCKFSVEGWNREIEINHQQQEIEARLKKEFGSPCEFRDMSCEMIAAFLLREFPAMVEAQVLEDGYGGSTLTR